MTRRHQSRILVTLAFLVYLVSPAGAAWYCEGRQCGTSFGACCCALPSAQRDLNCDKTARAESKPRPEKNGALACPAGCHCVMMTAGDNAQKTLPAPLVIVHVAALPPLPSLLYLPPPPRQIVFSRETRGPPAASAPLLPLGPRAPPLA